MQPTVPLPAPDALPAHYLVFQVLETVTLVAHFLAMNLVLGGAIIFWWRSAAGGARPDPVVPALAGSLPATVAVAVNLGVAPLLFVQVLYGHLLYTSSILMAVYWLAVIGCLILAYATAYLVKYRLAAGGAAQPALLTLVVACLLAIAFFMTNNFTLMQRIDLWPAYFDHPEGTLLNLGDATLWPRYLHMVASAVAVAGLGLAWYGRLLRRDRPEQRLEIEAAGRRWCIVATMVNFAFGAWFLAAVSAAGILRGALFWWFHLLVAAGVLLAALGLVQLGGGRLGRASLLLLAAVAAMVVGRELLRVAQLAPWFQVTELTVEAQYTPLFVFLLSLAAGAALVVWMVGLVWPSGRREEGRP